MHVTASSVAARTLCGVIALALSSTSALAVEESYVPDQAEVVKDDKPPEKSGWDYGLRIGASIAFTNSMHVVGKQDGSTFTFGLSTDANADYVNGKHDWRNSLSIAETFSLTPASPDIMATQDRIYLESIYVWKGLDWLGPYARFTFLSSLLPGFDHQATKMEYGTLDADGNFQGEGRTRSRHKLTRPFQPLTLSESAGVFARPYDKPFARIDVRAGVGAQEIFAAGAKAVSNVDADLGQVTLKTLDDSFIFGAELAAYIEGKLLEDKITYKAGGEVLIPFVEASPIQDKAVGDRINVSMGAALSFRLVEWASVDYQLAVLRQPQVIEEWQIVNQLLLTFGYTFKK